MKVVLFGGTTEGRMLSGALVALGAQVTVCVATEYGCREQGTCSGVSVRTGRLEEAEMEKVLHGAALCVDATHPYAVRASGNIAAACARAGVPRLRLLRRESPLPADAAVFSTARQAGQSSWSGFSSGLPQFLQVSIALPRVFLIFSRRSAAGVYSRA